MPACNDDAGWEHGGEEGLNAQEGNVRDGDVGEALNGVGDGSLMAASTWSASSLAMSGWDRPVAKMWYWKSEGTHRSA